jgi:hypothetical protein
MVSAVVDWQGRGGCDGVDQPGRVDRPPLVGIRRTHVRGLGGADRPGRVAPAGYIRRFTAPLSADVKAAVEGVAPRPRSNDSVVGTAPERVQLR